MWMVYLKNNIFQAIFSCHGSVRSQSVRMIMSATILKGFFQNSEKEKKKEKENFRNQCGMRFMFKQK